MVCCNMLSGQWILLQHLRRTSTTSKRISDSWQWLWSDEAIESLETSWRDRDICTFCWVPPTRTQRTHDLKTQEIHMFIGEIEKWFWNLKNIHFSFNWSKDSVTFEKVDFPTSALRLISINSHLALSEKLFLQSPLWDLNCGGLDFFQAVNWKSSSKPCWLKSKLDSRRVTNIEYIVIYQLCSSKFIPKNRRKKELSRSGSIFRKNKERKKEYGKLQHPQPTASLHLRAHRLGNACQVLAHWEEPEEIDPPQN